MAASTLFPDIESPSPERKELPIFGGGAQKKIYEILPLQGENLIYQSQKGSAGEDKCLLTPYFMLSLTRVSPLYSPVRACRKAVIVATFSADSSLPT